MQALSRFNTVNFFSGDISYLTTILVQTTIVQTILGMANIE
jgi:hypothetical protein